MESEATSSVVATTKDRLKTWNRYLNDVLASEISGFTRYYDQLIQWRPRSNDTGYLLEKTQCRSKKNIGEFETFPDLSGETERRTAVLLNGTFNHNLDTFSSFF